MVSGHGVYIVVVPPAPASQVPSQAERCDQGSELQAIKDIERARCKPWPGTWMEEASWPINRSEKETWLGLARRGISNVIEREVWRGCILRCNRCAFSHS